MNLSPLPIQKFFDNNGRPLARGLLFTYVSGTTTKIATYKDAAGTLNTNPIVLDFRGECRLWIDPTKSYTYALAPRTDTDPPTSPFWTVNDVTAAPFAFDNAAIDTGSVNNIQLAIAQISAPVAFTRIVFKAANTNTGAVTISINGGTAKALTLQNISALSGAEIVANGLYQAVFDGAQWQLQDLLGIGKTAAETAATATPTAPLIPMPPMDPRRLGAAGDGSTDNTTLIQKCFDAAKNFDGRVHFSADPSRSTTRYVCSTVQVYEGTHVTADEGVVIVSAVTNANDHVFQCISTQGSATALTANAAKRDQSVAVTSISGLSAGQVVIIRDNTFKYGANGRNLELNEIDSISVLTVTLKNRLIGNYTTANSAELVPLTQPARNIKFENVRLEVPSGKDGGGIYFQEAYECEVLNSECSGQKGQPGIQIWRSAYINVHGGTYKNGQSQSTPGYGYGISMGSSTHNSEVRGTLFENVRECAVSDNVRFSGFTNCDSISSYDNAFNSHATGAEDCFFVNCRSFSARSKGFYCGGAAGQAGDKRIRFVNCENWYSGYIGFWMDGAAGVESEDCEFVDCKDFHPGDDTGTSFSYYAFRSTRPRIINCTSDADGEANVRSCIKAEVCTDVEIRGCRARGATSGWGIIHANCTGVKIEENWISNIGAAQGVHAESTASTKVFVRNNRVDNDTAFTRVANDVQEWNIYNTKRDSVSGAAAGVADGGTVTHGCISNPTWVNATGSVASQIITVTAKGGTTFTVAIKTDAGAAGTAQTIYWQVGI